MSARAGRFRVCLAVAALLAAFSPGAVRAAGPTVVGMPQLFIVPSDPFGSCPRPGQPVPGLYVGTASGPGCVLVVLTVDQPLGQSFVGLEPGASFAPLGGPGPVYQAWASVAQGVAGPLTLIVQLVDPDGVPSEPALFPNVLIADNQPPVVQNIVFPNPILQVGQVTTDVFVFIRDDLSAMTQFPPLLVFRSPSGAQFATANFLLDPPATFGQVAQYHLGVQLPLAPEGGTWTPFLVHTQDTAGNSLDQSPVFCESGCPQGSFAVPTVVVVDAGGTATSGGSVGAPPTPSQPVVADVTTPNAGTITIVEHSASTPPPSGYAFVGQSVVITAPAASASIPLTLVFSIDASIIPAGVTAATLQLFRDGLLVPDCTGAPQAIPDPCISFRETLAGPDADGDIRLTALTSAASEWSFAVASDTVAPTVTGSPDRLPNAAGWYTAPVTIDWHASDPAPSSGTPTDPADTLASVNAANYIYTSGPSCDLAGNCATGSLALSIDTVAPTATAPSQSFTTNVQMGLTTADLTISWTATDATSGIGSVALQESVNGGAWVSVPVPAGTSSVRQTLTLGKTYSFRVQPTDVAGNVGGWAVGPAFKVAPTDNAPLKNGSIIYSGKWSAQSIATAYGGTDAASSGTGATASFAFKGTAVAYVAPVNTNRGQAQILLDGTLVATVDLNCPAPNPVALPRMVLFARSGLASNVSHTIVVRVVGTPGRPQIDVDAFLVTR